MTKYTIKAIAIESIVDYATKKITKGDLREWALCDYYGIKRTTHDSQAYNVASDVEAGEKHISVKASGFTLMGGSLCEGKEDFDGIWGVFEKNVHSNRFAYVTQDYTVYEMNINEFKEFVYRFCYINRDSKQNGGRKKIKALKESQKMRNWLAAKIAA